MTTYYFGAPWDAPAIVDSDAEQVETPVGDSCLDCHEPIVDGEQGFILPNTYVGQDGKNHVRPTGEHRECFFRSVFGNVFCMTGVHSEHDTPKTWREQGKEVLAWFNEQRAKFGLPPL